MSQDPDTKDHIIVLQDGFCNKCGEEYIVRDWNWCRQCRKDDLKKNFTNWTSGSEKIDNLIQEIQLKVNGPSDIVFEWIPYDQFNDFKEIGKGGFATVYSAIWKDGQLEYDENTKTYIRASPNQKVALKRLHNSQNITNEFLNEV
jgi:hypothetical protein